MLSGWLLTNVQENITTTIHATGHTFIYITLLLLFIFFFTPLPFSWAGWLSSIPYVCYNRDQKGLWEGVVKGSKGLVGRGQLKSAWNWRGVKFASLYKELKHQIWDFLYIFYQHPCVAIHYTYVCAVNMLPVLFIFFSSQVKNKPRDGDLKHTFILGLTSFVANTDIQYILHITVGMPGRTLFAHQRLCNEGQLLVIEHSLEANWQSLI